MKVLELTALDPRAPRLLTVEQAAAFLSLPEPTVYYHIGPRNHADTPIKMASLKLGGRWRFQRDKLIELLGLDWSPAPSTAELQPACA